MSQRRKERHAATLATPAELDRAPVRRILLGAVTALIVARPLVAGEDPARLHSLEASSGQILNLLWLLLALATASWGAWSSRALQTKGLLAAGLMLLAALMAFSTYRNECYRHAAWLTACEWALLPVIFVVVLETTRDADSATDSAGGLLAALLASAMSVAAFTLYQALASAARWKSPDLPFTALPPLPAGDAFLAETVMPEPAWISHGTFERSDTLFGYLLLLFPLVALLGWRERSAKTRFGLAAALVALAAMFLAGSDFLNAQLPQRLHGGWATARTLIEQSPLVGVGPGNFARHAPRAQRVEEPGVLTESWSAFAEVAATAGVPALLLFAGLLVLAIIVVRRARAPESREENRPERGPRWEFYLGGALGLILGLGLRVHDLPGTEPSKAILLAGFGAVARALIWFLAFALFENMTGRSETRRRAFFLGLCFAAVFSLVSGALVRPPLLQSFWIVAALALGGTATSTGVVWPRIAAWSLMPILLAAAWGYATTICEPAVASARHVRFAHLAARDYAGTYQYDIQVAPPAEKEAKRQAASVYMARNIIRPLQEAIKADPNNVELRMEESAWFRAYWRLVPISKRDEALERLDDAARLDPIGAEPLVRALQLRLTFATIDPRIFPEPAKVEKYVAELRTANLKHAAELIPRILARDPALEARLRFPLAETLLELKDDERHKQGLTQAARALELDDRAPGPRWRLSKEQRAQVEKWLKPQGG